MTLRLLAAAILLGVTDQAAHAQGLVGGRLREARTTRPLACWRTELRDASDRVLAFAIDSAGRVDVDAAFMWGASHPGFEAAVQRALPDMRFADVTRPGGPACAFVASPFLFRLSPP